MKKILLLLVLTFFLSHASTQAKEDEFLNDFESEYSAPVEDPLIGYNRLMHNINWGFYDYVLSPTLDTYNSVVPLGFRIGIYNFFDNLASPLRFLSHLLAGEPKNAMDELGRFTLNSTAGVLGIFDIASENGLYSRRNDFGITFGKWGISGGFHIVLPFMGPSNLRDAVALPLNALAYPPNYLNPAEAALGAGALEIVNYTARHKGTLDSMHNSSLDTYILFRDSYEQRRAELISEK